VKYHPAIRIELQWGAQPTMRKPKTSTAGAVHGSIGRVGGNIEAHNNIVAPGLWPAQVAAGNVVDDQGSGAGRS
jgi:hypothetical protein